MTRNQEEGGSYSSTDGGTDETAPEGSIRTEELRRATSVSNRGVYMERRGLLTAVGAGSVFIFTGCIGGGSPEVSEDNVEEFQRYEFEAEAGNTIRAEVTNNGPFTAVAATNPSGDLVIDVEIQGDERTVTYQVEEGGTFVLDVVPEGEASIEIYVES